MAEAIVSGAPLVIFNPKAGRGLAGRAEELLRHRLPPGAEIVATREPGHATDLARAAVQTGRTTIASAGGDGTMHEVVNGIIEADRPGVVFIPLPFGSANDYAFSLGLTAWWARQLPLDALSTMAVDAAVITSGFRRRWFANGCGIGFNGMVTIEARKIPWLRGIPLYALAMLQALWKHYDAPPLSLEIDGRASTLPTLALTIGLAQREGGFPLTAAALLDDDRADLLRLGAISRGELIRHLPAMISGNLPRKHRHLSFDRGRRILIESRKPLCIHTDGEFFCRPEEGVNIVKIEVVPKRLTVANFPPELYGGEKFRRLRE